MKSRYWCLECGAYADSQCSSPGHVSEAMRLVASKWTMHKPRRFTVASAPEGGRGSVEHKRCAITGDVL